MTDPLLQSSVPIVAAPMAGGPSTPALVTAVAEAGGFGFLAGGYKDPAMLSREIDEVRAHTDRFGVNLFVPGPREVDAASFRAYAAEIQPEADVHGLRTDPVPITGDDDRWAEKLALLIESPVPVVSLTFALPAAREVAALRRAGTRVLASVTTHREARGAAAVGVDGLVVQGSDAGGHSATHDALRDPAPGSTASLVRRVRAAVDLPIIAAGAWPVPTMSATCSRAARMPSPWARCCCEPTKRAPRPPIGRRSPIRPSTRPW